MSSLHPTSFLMILVSLFFYPGLALTVARGEMMFPVRYTRTYAHAYCAHEFNAEVVTFTCNLASV